MHSSILRVTFPPEFYPVQVFSFVLQYLQGDILIWLLLDQYWTSHAMSRKFPVVASIYKKEVQEEGPPGNQSTELFSTELSSKSISFTISSLDQIYNTISYYWHTPEYHVWVVLPQKFTVKKTQVTA